MKPAVFLAKEPPLLFFYPAIEQDSQYLSSNAGQVPAITRFLKKLDGPLNGNKVAIAFAIVAGAFCRLNADQMRLPPEWLLMDLFPNVKNYAIPLLWKD